MLDWISNEGFHETMQRYGLGDFPTPRAFRERYITRVLKHLAERG